MASEAPSLPEDRVRLIARALADPTRHEILTTIGRCQQFTPCSAMRDAFHITAATLSHHMKELETAGLIEAQRDGKFVSYRLRRDSLNAYIASLASI